MQDASHSGLPDVVNIDLISDSERQVVGVCGSLINRSNLM